MTITDTIGHLSFLTAALSLCMKDIIFLRIISIISGLIGIVYNYYVTSNPLWVPIFWLSVFVLINIYMITRIYLENRTSNLSLQDIEIWKRNFLGLTLGEYKAVKKISTLKFYEMDEVLIHTGQENNFLYFINSGNFKVEKNNKKVNVLSQGDLVGEISFITNSLPNADVIAREKSSCIVIEKDELKSLMLKNPMLHISITSLFNIGLSKKLA